jgi:hypothetical protein
VLLSHDIMSKTKSGKEDTYPKPSDFFYWLTKPDTT